MKKELIFTATEAGNCYEAFAIVNADFNIHLEREQKGYVELHQSTIEGGKRVQQYATDGCVNGDWEEDFDNIVYPKYIRVVSGSMVRKGYITEVEE